jgi:hypothetical protein
MSTPCNMESFIVRKIDGARDRIEGDHDGVQDDEALEGAEGNDGNFGIFRCAAHEDMGE